MTATKAVLQLLSATCITALSFNAAAQARPDYGPAINVEAARKIAAGTVAECRNNKWNVAVAIVDTHGMLIFYERMDNTQVASADIAIMKARAAATYRRTTRDFLNAINKTGPATMTLPGVVASPGGVPIFVDGKVVGAVGVSGVTGDQDEQCAKAGVAAM
jgi:glc operon protein GlcG